MCKVRCWRWLFGNQTLISTHLKGALSVRRGWQRYPEAVAGLNAKPSNIFLFFPLTLEPSVE